MSEFKAIPYGRQNITQQDIDAVVNVLKSDFLTQGPHVALFENAFAEYIGVKYAVAVSNGTAALHLSTLALDVKEGDKVITTPITFAASANCVRYCGGDLVFADIDPKTYLIEIEHVRRLLESSPAGTYKGIIVVDFAGNAVDLEAFKALAGQFGCWLIEDACHSPGGYFKDFDNNEQRCGNGSFADLSVFSFHPVKHIACGEGGMITTNDEALYHKLIQLRTHGITKDPQQFTLESNRNEDGSWPLWYMEMQELGYNYRLTDFQSALGLEQLKRADDGILERRRIATAYEEAFRNKSYIKGQSGNVEGHAYHLYVIEVDKRNELFNYLRQFNIFAQVHYIPVHLMPYYRSFGWKDGDMPCAETYFSGCLSLPMYPWLSREEQAFVIQKIEDFFNV